MPRWNPETRLLPLPGIQVLSGEGGRAFVLDRGRAWPLAGLGAEEARAVLDAVGEGGTAAEVAAALAPRFSEDALDALLPALAGRLFRALPGSQAGSGAGGERETDDLVTASELRHLPSLFARPRRRRSQETEVRSVAVLGGGTAGYLAALTLRRKLPGLEVTVLESRDIPVIGVGEATTPLLPALLHGTLGIDMADFFAEVRPTLKLGIRFEWGRPAPYAFNYPFAAGPLADAVVHDGAPNAYCLASLLMEEDRSNLVSLGGGGLGFLPGPFAYHVDNRRFVAYLQRQAKEAGVLHRDCKVTDAVLGPAPEGSDGAGEPWVRALRTEEGETLSYDFYLDCSGFGSFLLGRTLETPFLSYAGSLFTDSALVADHPHGGDLKPYTTATTLPSGWCWRVPQEDCDHRGYVFSSGHATPEQARQEMAAANPALGDTRLLRFRCGRHRDFWRGNVAALGNAYGFVEPLESTALHMVAVTLATLVRHFPQSLRGPGAEPRHRRLVNDDVGEQWDRLRDFLALHFKLNGRLDTPFWRDCREQVDLAGAASTLDLFRERGPLSERPHPATFDSLWGDFGRDVLLLGQGAPGPPPRPNLSAQDWRRLKERGRALAARALPQRKAHQLLRRQPELLRTLQASAPWLQDSAVGGSEGW